jgi:hypothetical protein
MVSVRSATTKQNMDDPAPMKSASLSVKRLTWKAVSNPANAEDEMVASAL